MRRNSHGRGAQGLFANIEINQAGISLLAGENPFAVYAAEALAHLLITIFAMNTLALQGHWRTQKFTYLGSFFYLF